MRRHQFFGLALFLFGVFVIASASLPSGNRALAVNLGYYRDANGYNWELLYDSQTQWASAWVEDNAPYTKRSLGSSVTSQGAVYNVLVQLVDQYVAGLNGPTPTHTVPTPTPSVTPTPTPPPYNDSRIYVYIFGGIISGFGLLVTLAKPR